MTLETTLYPYLMFVFHCIHKPHISHLQSIEEHLSILLFPTAMLGFLFVIAATLMACFSSAIAAPTEYYGFFPNPDASRQSDPEIYANFDCSPKLAVSCEGDYRGDLRFVGGPCYNCASPGLPNHELCMSNVCMSNVRAQTIQTSPT